MSVRDTNYRSIEKRPTTTVDEKQHSANPGTLTRTAPNSENKASESRTDKPNFREDFLLEHTRFGQQADSIELAGCF